MSALRMLWKPLALCGALLMLVLRLAAGRRAAADLARERAYRHTREAMDAAQTVGDDLDLARRWLQSRDPDRR